MKENPDSQSAKLEGKHTKNKLSKSMVSFEELELRSSHLLCLKASLGCSTMLRQVVQYCLLSFRLCFDLYNYTSRLKLDIVQEF